MSGRIQYTKVLGEKNPADLLTKYMAADLMKRHLDTANMKVAFGRAESAPQIAAVEENHIDNGIQSWVQQWRGKKVGFDEVVDIRSELEIASRRDAAYAVALRRLQVVHEQRGIFP